VAGRDFNEVFAPVSKHATFRAIVALVASQDLEFHQIDIKTAFLNEYLDAEIYLMPPEGMRPMEPGFVWKLHKTLYGLKQSTNA
jgi:Reverse transcriptase (RNA-dependent DNA polymerase)